MAWHTEVQAVWELICALTLLDAMIFVSLALGMVWMLFGPNDDGGAA